MTEKYDSVIVKHFGKMYVWGTDSWDEDPTGHIKCGRELVVTGEYHTLRNIADIYNQTNQENQDA